MENTVVDHAVAKNTRDFLGTRVGHRTGNSITAGVGKLQLFGKVENTMDFISKQKELSGQVCFQENKYTG